MYNYTPKKSRLSRKEESRTYRKIVLALFATVVLFAFIIFFGLPALINMAVFISNLKGEGDLPINTKTLPLAPPFLDVPYEATNTAKISIRGTGISGTRAELFVNGESFKKILIPKNGSFIFDRVPLEKGENRIWGILENSLEEKSERSQIITIRYNSEAPKIEVEKPADGAVFSGDQKEIEISGMVEDSSVMITVNDRFVIVGSDGIFSYMLPLNEGENIIEIIAKDDFGNYTKVERKVTYSP